MKISNEFFLKDLKENYLSLYIYLTHHRTHKNIKTSLINYTFMHAMFFDKNPYLVIKKSTQNGQTEFLIVTALTKAYQGRSIFYVLPTFDLRNRFVSNRINTTINYTEFYKNILRGEKTSAGADSTSLKHIGKGSIAFIGSNSAASFTEFPADDLIIDELDRCDQSKIYMGEERLAASADPRKIFVSNPTIKDFGIDYEFNKSDKKLWHIKCDSCGKWLTPNFFEHIVKDVGENNYIVRDEEWNEELKRDIYLICNHCNKPIDRFKKGKWVKQDNYSNISGYQISKLFSTQVKVKELVDRFNEALKNDTKMQRFYNADLGEAYTAKGAKIDYDMLNDCKKDYSLIDKSNNPCVIGIDVGSVLHTIVAELLPDRKLKVIFIDELHSIEDIMNIYKRYNIKVGCIDALPEQALAKQICGLRGMFRVFIQEAKKETINLKTKIVTVDRTTTLDLVKEEILIQNILLPRNADTLTPLATDGISEFYNMICNSVRIYDEEKEKYKWVEGSKKDHYLFSLNFLLIARKILLNV